MPLLSVLSQFTCNLKALMKVYNSSIFPPPNNYTLYSINDHTYPSKFLKMSHLIMSTIWWKTAKLQVV